VRATEKGYRESAENTARMRETGFPSRNESAPHLCCKAVSEVPRCPFALIGYFSCG